MVPPDLEATTKSVRLRSMLSDTARTAAGWVLSRTISSGYPAALPNVAWYTSGARLDPPIPSNTTRSASERISLANSSIPPAWPLSSGSHSHPRRSVNSRISTVDHKVWSLAHRRAPKSCSSHAARRACTREVNPPRAKEIEGTPDITRQIRCDSLPRRYPDAGPVKPSIDRQEGTRTSHVLPPLASVRFG